MRHRVDSLITLLLSNFNLLGVHLLSFKVCAAVQITHVQDFVYKADEL